LKKQISHQSRLKKIQQYGDGLAKDVKGAFLRVRFFLRLEVEENLCTGARITNFFRFSSFYKNLFDFSGARRAN